MVSKIEFVHLFGVWSSNQPPGFSTRRTSARCASVSGMCSRTSKLSTISKCSSGKGRAVPAVRWIGNASYKLRLSSIRVGFVSTPTTSRPRAVSWCRSVPRPHPISSSLRPDCNRPVSSRKRRLASRLPNSGDAHAETRCPEAGTEAVWAMRCHSISMFHARPSAMRLTAGALIGVGAWVAVSASLSLIPVPLRFLLGWLIFTLGPGIAIAGYFTRDLDPLRRVTVLLGAGSAAAPAMIDALGRTHLVPAFPYLAAALCGSGLAMWRGRSTGATSRGDLVACVALVALAVGLGAIVFGNRLVESPAAGIVLYGEYDSADISYYAAEASEAAHTVPPMASYYSGHRLNAAYYPQLVFAMIHRFVAVPVLTIYFRYAWPTFLCLSALAAFVLVRSLASRGMAVLAVILILIGSDFSYLAAWSLQSQPPAWDWVLWPRNFLSPTMQLLQFNTWGPSLPVFLTLLFVIVLGLQTRRWSIVSAVLLAILFQFKPFAYAILMAALAAAVVFSGRDRLARWHFAATAGIGVVLTL